MVHGSEVACHGTGCSYGLRRIKRGVRNCILSDVAKR